MSPNIDRGTTGTLYTAWDSAPGTGVMLFSVFSGNSHTHLDRQALVKLTNLETKTAMWQTTEEGAKAIIPNVPFGKYAVEVSAVGYVTASQPVSLVELARIKEVSIVLEKDPTAIQIDVEDAGMPPKARKEMKQASTALKSNNLQEAQRHLEAARKLSSASAQLNFLFGYLHFQKREYDQAGQYLSASLAQQPENVQALVLLGRSNLEKKDYGAAQAALEKAVALDSESWLPHSLLADSYLRQRQYAQAQSQAALAIQKGLAAASPAQLVLGQAWLGLGRDQQAVQALEQFLHDAPGNPLAPQVRNLIAEVEKGAKSTHESMDSAGADSDELSGVDPLQAMPKAVLPVRPWQPTGIDEVKPTVVHGVSCPLDSVLQQSGTRVAQLVEDVSRFAAVEDLFHQRLDKYGIPVLTETRKFNYVASIAEPEPGYLEVNEYRAEKITLAGYPDHIASTGFATLAFVFHPHVRENFEMQCEGLGDWQGQATWLVHFRQRDDRPNRMHAFQVGTRIYTVGLKGRAWIRADNFQIVRIESELVEPKPDIQLRSEHQIVEYGPIPFGKAGVSLWLPKSAELYFDFRRQRFYRRHSFDHYMLFAVGTEERRKEPTAPAKATAQGAEPPS